MIDKAELRRMSQAVRRELVGMTHSLRRTPLARHGLDEALPRGLAERRAERTERGSRTRQSA